MNNYLRLGLLVLGWSIFMVGCLNHFILHQNPFLALVGSGLLLVAVLIQLIRLRKRGVVYIGIFLLGLLFVTEMLSYADTRIFSPARRYYGFISQRQ